MQSEMTGSWIPVALSADLPAGTVIPASLPGETLALWRSASGKPAASADRCPHRGMRLSHGFVRGEALSCIYHGWSYGASGACLRIPAHPGLVPPEAIRVATHRVTEHDGILWIALGEPAEDPPSLSPWQPLRSMTAGAAPAALEAATGVQMDDRGLLHINLRSGPLALLLAEQPEGQTLVHVLVAPGTAGAAAIAASRAAEGVRRKAEAMDKTRSAA